MINFQHGCFEVGYIFLQRLPLFLSDEEKAVGILWHPSTGIEVSHGLLLLLLEEVDAPRLKSRLLGSGCFLKNH